MTVAAILPTDSDTTDFSLWNQTLLPMNACARAFCGAGPYQPHMSYRDDLQAAKDRRNALARELRTVEKHLSQLDALRQRKRQLEGELDRAAGEMDRARARVTLPMLSRVKVASPCHESWDRMSGDDRVRFCGQCEKSVFDLSAMTAEQAESLLREHGASLCVRFYKRRDGTVMTSDCPTGRRDKRRRRIAAVAMAASLMTAGLGHLMTRDTGDDGRCAIPAQVETGSIQIEEVEVTMGEMEIAETPDPPEELEVLMGKMAIED